MDEDDPEKRIAELERELAERKRIAELEHQIAQAKAAAPGQDAPVPPPQWPGTPPSPSAPDSGQPTGFKASWVSVDGGGFQPVGGQGTGAVLPPQAAEQLAGLVDGIVRQAGVSEQGRFAGQGGYPQQVGGFGPQPASWGSAAGRGRTGLGELRRAYPAAARLIIAALCLAVIGPLVPLSSALGAVVLPFSWRSEIICRSGYHLVEHNSVSFSGGGTSTNVSYQCVNGDKSYVVNAYLVSGLEFLVGFLLLFGVAAVGYLLWRLLRKPR